MSLKNAVFKTGATWSPTGGTDLTLIADGRNPPNGLSMVVSNDTSLITRRRMVCVSTLPGLPANPQSYAKLARNKLTYRIPFVASDGKLYTQTIEISMAFHAEDSSKSVHVRDVAAFVADSDFLDFWDKSLLT